MTSCGLHRRTTEAPTIVQAINGILADGDQAELLIVLHQVVQALGGMQAVTE